MPPSPPDVAITVGVDLVSVARLRRLLDDHPRAADELFTPHELAYCGTKRNRVEHLAARFAAKEAVLKAFGSGLARRMSWSEVEIVNDGMGKPEVRLHGEVAAWARGRKVKSVDVSLSHTGGLAIAQAVAVGHA